MLLKQILVAVKVLGNLVNLISLVKIYKERLMKPNYHLQSWYSQTKKTLCEILYNG
jgi:hypothetical protein